MSGLPGVAASISSPRYLSEYVTRATPPLTVTSTLRSSTSSRSTPLSPTPDVIPRK
jgi:hypothetical protein